MIFLDASALVSIIAGEPDARELARPLQSEACLCSAVSVWETVAGLCRSYKMTVTEARGRFAQFRDALNLRFVPIGEREHELALAAHEKFGKGRHKAALNMGDCFAYACAKAHGAALLFKGDDFPQTDILPAAQI